MYTYILTRIVNDCTEIVDLYYYLRSLRISQNFLISNLSRTISPNLIMQYKNRLIGPVHINY